MTRRHRPVNAVKFMAQLQWDEEYQRKKAAFDAELQERVSEFRAAEQPIVAHLRKVEVSTQAGQLQDLSRGLCVVA